MRTRLTHTLALLGALSLTACGSDTQEQPDDTGWCVDQEECEAAEGPTVAPPIDLGPVRDLAVHRGTACALTDSRVWCWGDDTYGQARPPEDELSFADRLVLTEKYGCAVGPVIGFVCWGDGVAEIAEADGAQTIGRHTLFGVSGNSGVMCHNSDYRESSSPITCYDAQESWQVGPRGAIAVDVQYDEMFGGYPTVCYALSDTERVRYTYQCMHGDAVIELTSTEGAWAGIRPTIKHDGKGLVSVLLADGDVAWYSLGLVGRAESRTPLARQLEVDWGTSRGEFDANREGVELLSPNCLNYGDEVMLCRNDENLRVAEYARAPSTIMAAHEFEGEVSYCYLPGDSTSPGGAPVCETTRR